MAARVRVNLAELERELRAPDGALAKELTRACLEVEQRAKRYAPVDTGRLRASITFEIDRIRDNLVGRVGTNVEYALHVEYGTRFMAPRPFLRRALSDTARSF